MNAIGKALWYIESHSARPVTLDELAEVSGLSRFHLSRTFTVVVGRSPTAYLRARRLSEAARALADDAPDILSVALDAGYGSHEAFTRAFREQFGATPEDVRAACSTANLKLVEPPPMTNAPAAQLADPDIREAGPLLIAGMRQRFTHETRGAIPALWQRFTPHIGHIPNEKPQATFGVVISSGEDSENGFDYMTGIGVSSLDELPEELAGLRVPKRSYAVFKHDGHVSTIGATCGAIFGTWLPRSGRKLADGPLQLIERYETGKFDPRTGLGGFEIWIPLEK
jgi:AraC family transcriptional regulator